MLATLGALEFVGNGDGATYTIESLTGWFEGAEVRRERIDRPNDDGEFDTPGFLTGLLITVQGLILAESETALVAAIEALGNIPVRELTEFVVTTGAGSKAAMVRRADRPDISVNVWGLSANYRLALFAPNPTRYTP